MSAPLIVSFPGNAALARQLAEGLSGEIASVEFHRFPDDESYIRFDTNVAGRSVIFACTLDRPDRKIVLLAFAARTARELGAKNIGLAAPYLAYMRQDKRFKPGEAITSTIFADLLSDLFDWLVTVDPHLHRRHDLRVIYRIRARALHAAPRVAQWIREDISSPLLIGPDDESAQWVSAIAADAGAPYVVLQKTRRGDRDVDVSDPDIAHWRNCTPIVIDDIISSGRTMIETLARLRSLDMKPAVCVGVHAVFAAGAYEALRAAGPMRIVTSNTIPHVSNAIDVTALLIEAIREIMDLQGYA